VDDITSRVLSGEDIVRHTNGEYFVSKELSKNIALPQWQVAINTAFLKKCSELYSDYYIKLWNADEAANYEDLYYLAKQVSDALLDEFGNPAILGFVDSMKVYMEREISKDEYSYGRDSTDLRYNAGEACRYVKGVCSSMLNRGPRHYDSLKLIKELLQVKSDTANLGIFTLNHDKYIENFFRSADIPFCDGFSKLTAEVANWSPEIYQNPCAVRLYKLHGSIDWIRFRRETEDADWHDEFVGKRLDPLARYPDDANGVPLIDIDFGEHQFLVGTTNKLLEYHAGIYAELMYYFVERLKYSSELIISGYGFGDRGINTKIAQWFTSSRENRLIIIHGNMKKLREKGRGIPFNKWDEWVGAGRLVLIEKWIEEVTAEDILQYIN